MKLLVIADDKLVGHRIPEYRPDLLLSLGDLPDKTILKVARRCACPNILAVKGNHDSPQPFPLPIHDLHMKTVQFGGLTFGGFGGAWKFKPHGDHLFDQEEVEKHLAGFPAVDIFLAHNSPRHIHDSEDGVHIGFTAFNSYIAREQPKLFLHGHQHHEIRTDIGGTRVLCVFGYRYLTIPDPASAARHAR
jgi:uncharacterized protein